MRLAKTVPREFLEQARSFVLDANANSRARLFMWKIKQIRMEKKDKEKAMNDKKEARENEERKSDQKKSEEKYGKSRGASPIEL